MTTQKLRLIVIVIVVLLCVVPLIYMMLEGMWGEVITAILGVAGFILTYEVTKSKPEDKAYCELLFTMLKRDSLN